MKNDVVKLLQRANTLFAQEKYKPTLQLTKRLLEEDPKNHEALIIRANAFHAMGDLDNSIPAYEKILEFYPSNHTVIIILLQHYSEHKDWEKLTSISRYALQNPQQANTFTQAYIESHGLCDWEYLHTSYHALLDTIRNNNNDSIIFQQLLFTLLTLPYFTEDEIFETHKIVAKRFMNIAAGNQYTTHQKAGKKLKIGYVSGDFSLHPVGIFIQFCIELHHRDYFEIYCYADLVHDDRLTDKFRAMSNHFVDITAQPADQVAKKIHNDGINILIDLGGYTGRVLLEIFAYKPAPIQISYCGYPYSTALPTIDYRITDHYAEGSIKNYTEELIYMPESFLCMGGGYSETAYSPTPSERNGHITFGSFNDLRKINTPVIQLWSKVLTLTPDSKLLIRNRKVEAFFAKRIVDQFKKFGIDQHQLIFISGDIPPEEHCKYYQEVDIILDVFPFCGATTSLESLWYNVPIITLVGEAHRQRPTYSMLKNIGFTGGIAFSEQEYIDKAIAMAKQSTESLNFARRCLYTLTRSSVLFQPEAFTHQLDQLYIDTWNKKMGDDRTFNAKTPNYSYKFNLSTSSEKDVPSLNKIDRQADHSTEFTLNDGVIIAVPNDINLLTPYCIAEKQDWFESEIDFSRTFTQPGMKALDIGACYGAYSLPIANKLGESGSLWAFEPGNQAYKYLSNSIRKNNFNNTTLIATALSDHKGEAKLHTYSNVEFNSVNTFCEDNSIEQEISLNTLDNYLDQYQWENIDFVKIDTTGGELDIIKGGQSFFTTLSPLVLCACKTGTELDIDLIHAFKDLEYNTFILIPGLQILTPFSDHDSPDGFLLNLFFCKMDTAEKLQKRELLVSKTPSNNILPKEGWDNYLKKFTYSSPLLETWEESTREHSLPGWKTYKHALNLYVSAHSEQTPPEIRAKSLYDAFIQITSLVDIYITIPRLLSLIRIASELGNRCTALQLLENVIDNLEETAIFLPDEPFFAVSKAAEENPVDNSLANWCLTYCKAEKEILSGFSSYYLPDASSLELLETFEASNYSHDEILRRLTLMRKRFMTKGEASRAP